VIKAKKTRFFVPFKIKSEPAEKALKKIKKVYLTQKIN